MSININSKSSLVIAGSAALAGAVIYGTTWAFGKVKSRKSKIEEPEEEKTEVKEDSEK